MADEARSDVGRGPLLQTTLWVGAGLVVAGGGFYLYRSLLSYFWTKQAKSAFAEARYLRNQRADHDAAVQFKKALHCIKLAGYDWDGPALEMMCYQALYRCFKDMFLYGKAKSQALEYRKVLEGWGLPDTVGSELAYEYLGICYRHDFIAAERCYRGMKRAWHSSKPLALGKGQAIMARVSWFKGDLNRTSRYLQKALHRLSQVTLTHPDDLRLLTKIQIRQLKVLMLQGNFEQAKALLDQLGASTTPPLSDLRLLQAQVEMAQGDMAAAERLLKAILAETKATGEENPYFFAIGYCAQMYWSMGNERRALKMYKKLKRSSHIPPPVGALHFSNIYGMVVFRRTPCDNDQSMNRFDPIYMLVLDFAPGLPSSVFLEIEFERPGHPDEPLREERTVSLEDVRKQFWKFLTITSPPMEGMKLGSKYEVVVRMYRDESKEEKLDELHQLMQHNFPLPKKIMKAGEVPTGPLEEDIGLSSIN